MTKAFLGLAPLLIWLAGCGNAPRETASASVAPIAVNVITIRTQQWPSIYEATGTVRARYSTTISAKWLGYVREVKVQPGDHVREGQLLIVLDARDLDASSGHVAAARDEVRDAIPEADSAVAAAKANLDLVQATFRRMNELYGKKSISDQEFDEASAKLKAAQAAYEVARAKRVQLDSKLAQADQEVRAAKVTLSYARIQAPFAGVVTAKSVDPGNLAAPGMPLLTIEGGGYRVEASVDESKLSAIHLRQPVTVRLGGIDRRFDARVSEIVPAVDPASRAYIVKIDLPPNATVHSGMFAMANFELGHRSVIAIPAGAVSERGQLHSVFVADSGVARTRLITVGDRAKDQLEVLSGLSAGDRIIFPAPKDVSDGSRIKGRL
jgi:RND family efflux transporter MFP subunit